MTDTVQGITYDYTYDELNRVKTADADDGTALWGLSYDYDIWGNLHTRTVTAGSAPMMNLSMTWQNRVASFGRFPELSLPAAMTSAVATPGQGEEILAPGVDSMRR